MSRMKSAYSHSLSVLAGVRVVLSSGTMVGCHVIPLEVWAILIRNVAGTVLADDMISAVIDECRSIAL